MTKKGKNMLRFSIIVFTLFIITVLISGCGIDEIGKTCTTNNYKEICEWCGSTSDCNQFCQQTCDGQIISSTGTKERDVLFKYVYCTCSCKICG